MKQVGKVNSIILALGGLAGAVAALVALLTTIFDWPAAETTVILTIGAAALFVIGFMIDRIFVRVDSKLEGMEKRMVERDRIQSQAICRLELTNLIRHQPDNKVAIERKAKHYFAELRGNDYMSKMYSDWSDDHDGDVSFVISHE